jgi:hypothetical protein
MEYAQRVATHLGSGGQLIPMQGSLRLEPGELQFAHVDSIYFRFSSANVSYNQSMLLGFGSVGTLAATAIGSAVWNSRKRQQAQRIAAAQWRCMGNTPVVVTSQRLLLMGQMAWHPMWFGHILQVVPAVDRFELAVLFEGAPALGFQGPNTPLIAVLLIHLLYGEVLRHPALGTGG